MFGKLTLDAIPYHEPIIVGTMIGMALIGAIVLGGVTYLGKWKYLWTEWLTSVDHKRLGVMYIVVALVQGGWRLPGWRPRRPAARAEVVPRARVVEEAA